MTTDIRIAFAHPEVRAAATAGDGTYDRISLRDHVVEVEIGAFQAERGKTQRLRFNIVLEIAPADGPVDDDVDRILSYDTIAEAIRSELAAERLNLLETLAEQVAARVLRAPQARRIFVRIEKLDRGSGALGVEIGRSRGPLARAPDQTTAPRPVVVFLSTVAIAWAGLDAWIDEMSAMGPPLVLCLGPAGGPVLRSPARASQRRIDLLAIEQNAWVLAGRVPRLAVTGTRTELDWAMKNGKVPVWAPSKMVLDAVDGPAGAPADGLGLAVWLAAMLDARELITLGIPAPADAPVPAHSVPVTI